MSKPVSDLHGASLLRRARLAVIVLLLFGVGLLLAGDTFYVYDEVGRVTRAYWSDGTVFIYTYDPAGNILNKKVTRDSDGDRLLDDEDNCPNHQNPGQEDADVDGHGAACDCDDGDLNNWTSCATCLNIDGDSYYAGCDSYVTIPGPDCNDGDDTVYPDAPQLCDGINNDCNDPDWPGLPDLETDDDGDGWTECGGDCDDSLESVYPGARQVCDGVANDCSDPSWPATHSWYEHAISTSAVGAQAVVAADVDGDLDPDVFSASRDDGKLAWYENDAGDGSVWLEHPIAISPGSEPLTVYAADLDGDGDVDLLGASSTFNTISWYENTEGDGSVWWPHSVGFALNPASVIAADVDGDQDLDALTASFGDDTVAWYENTEGDGSTWTKRTIATTADFAYSVFAADLDGDQDTDVLSASQYDDRVTWYENTAGDGSAWTEHTISTTADAARSVFAADVDGDEDVDVLSASYDDDKIAWYENDGTPGGLGDWTEHIVTEDTGEPYWNPADGAAAIFAADMDEDGDTDILHAAFGDSNAVFSVAWWENEYGNGSGWMPHPVPHSVLDQAMAVFPADVDGDGAVDLLVASQGDDKIAWHQNLDDTNDDGDPAPNCADCDRMNWLVYPGAPQVCDGSNNDCDDAAYPTPPADDTDDDSDGFVECGPWVGFGEGPPWDGYDCDDTRSDVYPGAPQVCDGINNDCNHLEWPGLQDTNESDHDGDSWSECAGDCAEGAVTIHPGADEVCDGMVNDCLDPGWPGPPFAEEADDDGDEYSNCDDNCPEVPNPDQADFDADGYGDDCDCDPADPMRWGGAEHSDATDNDCPGTPGFGLTDEIERCGFRHSDKTLLSWQHQPGALFYEVARFSGLDGMDCQLWSMLGGTAMSDPDLPSVGAVHYYLVRVSDPYSGDWGADSAGLPRILAGCP